MARPTVLIEDFADMLGFDTPAPQEQAEPITLPVQGGLTEMNFSDMESFPNHKFKLYEGQRLADMADSIKQFGILLPIILWHTEDGKNIILSGHNRRNAAMLAGLEAGPVIIKEKTAGTPYGFYIHQPNQTQKRRTHYEKLYEQGKQSDCQGAHQGYRGKSKSLWHYCTKKSVRVLLIPH